MATTTFIHVDPSRGPRLTPKGHRFRRSPPHCYVLCGSEATVESLQGCPEAFLWMNGEESDLKQPMFSGTWHTVIAYPVCTNISTSSTIKMQISIRVSCTHAITYGFVWEKRAPPDLTGRLKKRVRTARDLTSKLLSKLEQTGSVSSNMNWMMVWMTLRWHRTKTIIQFLMVFGWLDRLIPPPVADVWHRWVALHPSWAATSRRGMEWVLTEEKPGDHVWHDLTCWVQKWNLGPKHSMMFTSRLDMFTNSCANLP